MKYVVKGLLYLISFVILILSLVMIFFEARLLISGDWLLSGAKFYGFVRYLARLIIACSYLFMLIYTFIKQVNNIKIIKDNMLNIDICLFVISFILLLCCANFEGIIIFILMLLFGILKYIDIYLMKRKIV